MGKDTLQFVQQPDGNYTPPANCTMTLTQSNSAYSLQSVMAIRSTSIHSDGLNGIADQYGQSLSVSYLTPAIWVSTVKDWKGRTLTFNYTRQPT